jgi:hypothetical protein
MIIRLRQILTVFLLLLFSLENVANAAIDNTCRENFSANQNLSAQKESVTIFMWIIEQNENEERDDDKTHGVIADFTLVPLSNTTLSNFFAAGFHPVISNSSHDSAYILKLVCKLSI